MPSQRRVVSRSSAYKSTINKRKCLKRKFLKVPVWIWLILQVRAVAGFAGNDNTAAPGASVSSTTEVDVNTTQESIAQLESVLSSTGNPSEHLTVMPIVEAIAIPMPTVTQEPATDFTIFVLRQGDKNDNVKALQKVLISLGWLTGTADGDYGPKTVSAVKAYQSAAGLPITGECDYGTYLSLTGPEAPVAPTSEVKNEDSVEVVYIGNRSSKKFHYPSCSSVDDMKEIQ